MALPDWIPKPIRKIINVLDNPIDDAKHWLNGRIFFGRYKLRIDCLMANKPGPCRIIDLKKKGEKD